MMTTVTPTTAVERRAEIRRMIAARGWTEELERIASMRVALAMQSCGLTPPAPPVFEDEDAPYFIGGKNLREQRIEDQNDD